MATKKPTLAELAAMDSSKWYNVRTTTDSTGSSITAKKHGAPGRYFLAWDRADLMRLVHYGESFSP